MHQVYQGLTESEMQSKTPNLTQILDQKVVTLIQLNFLVSKMMNFIRKGLVYISFGSRILQ